MLPGPIIFLHLQKTGGTSIRRVIRQVYGQQNVYVPGKPDDNAVDVWAAPADIKCQRAAAIMGHMPFGIHRLLGRDTPYFTIVRDPTERILSRYRKTSDFRTAGVDLLSTWPQAWSMTGQLAGLPRNAYGNLTEYHVQQALENLRQQFLYVGDTSRMKELGRWLCKELGWPVRLPLPWVNKAREGAVVFTAEELELARTTEVLELDRQLYRRICELGPKPTEWVSI